MTHDERECYACQVDRQATNNNIWWHVLLFTILVVVGFAIGYWHG